MKGSRIIISIIISLVALFLRVNLAINGPFEYDEPVYIAAAVQYNQAIRQGDWNVILNPTKNPEHPPLYKIIYAVGLMPAKPIASTNDIDIGSNLKSVPYYNKILLLRLISALFGTAAVFLLCLFHPLAGLFLAVNTFAIKFTSTVYLEALPAAAVIACMLAAEKALAVYLDHPPSRKKWAGWVVLSAFLLGLSAASKYCYGLVGVAVIAYVITCLWKQKRSALLGLAMWGVLSLLFFFLLNPEIWNATIERLAGSINFYLNYSNSQHVIEVGYPFWQPLHWLMFPIQKQTIEPIAYFVTEDNFLVEADLVIFGLAVLGMPRLFSQRRSMFLWLALGLLFLLIWNTKWPQYILLILAPFCLSAAYGTDWLWSKLRKIKLV